MAALLRSARLLRFSPSGSLQIVGTKRNGPPLSRLYGGAVGGRTTGPCTRQVACGVGTAPRNVWPCASSSSGTMRCYAVSTEQRVDEASLGVRSKQAQQFDWALAKLDNSVRRTGRITRTQLLRIFHDICRTGYPSGNQALLLLRSCGSLMPEMSYAERTELAHRIWDKLQELGASYDSSHYNALLKVYLQNEFKFSPTKFLAKMEAANVAPNRVTYQRLIAAYCQDGDIEGASTILGFMKSKDLPITEAVFNSLLTGHAKAGDMESAVNILPVMRGAGIEPGPDTYVALLTAYADKGDMENIKKTMETVEAADSSLMDRDLMQVIFSLAMAGHQQHIPELVECMRHERGYVPDAMNLCLSLITQGQEDTAFTILKTFPTLQADTHDGPNLGNFFLRHLVNIEKPVEKIVDYCKDLQDANLHGSPLMFTLSCALEDKKTGFSYELMKAVKEQGLPLRPHYFWPLLVQHVKDSNPAGVLEVLKNMQELGVAADVETFSRYILPVFPNREAARQALEEVGCSLESEGFLSSFSLSEIHSVATTDLAALYAMLSDPSFPAMELSAFRGSLVSGFKKCDNVEDMVKITEFLHNDPRFCRDNSTPSEAVSYFLYSLINSFGEQDLRAQEEKLRQYFQMLKSKNIVIPYNIYRGIRNILASFNIEGLIKDVLLLVDPSDTTSRSSPRVTGVEGKMLLLEKELFQLKEEGKPGGAVFKQLLLLLCAEDKLERAVELKQEYEDELSAGSYASLINIHCRHDNVEEAINLKIEMSRKDSSAVLDASKYLNLVKILAKHGRMDEAVDMLKEMREKEVMLKEQNITTLFHLFNSLGAKGDIESVRRLQDTVFTLGLTKPTGNLCSPLITAYLESNDTPGALDAAMECHKRFKQMPRIHDIIVALVEKGDTDLLQKAMDFVSQERGEMTMLYDLFFAFMHTARYREARKIIETPGLRARTGRLQWYAEKCIGTRQMEPLENMVELTAKLFECDRDEMYSYILRLCKETNDFQKAEATWTKMQEENVIPRERTLLLLADILKSNGQKVPFEVPEMWFEDVSTKEEVQVLTEAPSSGMAVADPAPANPTRDRVGNYTTQMLTLCKKNKAKEAYELLKDAHQKGLAVIPATYDILIRSLLSAGSLEEAMQVKDMAVSRVSGFQLNDNANSLLILTHCKKGQTKEGMATLKAMLQADQVPTTLALTRLVQALAQGPEADAAAIQEVASLTKALGSSLTVSSMLFPNNTALAHIRRGDVDSAVEVLEAVYTAPESSFPSMSYVFRKVLEENHDKALDKLSAMAEHLANHFACYRPNTDLFLELFEMDKVEDAKFLLARCNAVAEQKSVMVSYLTRLSKKPGQVERVKSLFSLIPDFTEKDVQYTYMMKCYALDNDLASAKALHEQMQKEGADVDELTLKRLAALYRRAGEAVPYVEPPESFKFYAEKLKERKAPAETSRE